MNRTCLNFCPIENLMTDISNMIEQGFHFEKIRDRLFDPFSIRLKKYENVIQHIPEFWYDRAYQAVIDYNEGYGEDGTCWSDYVCWVYTNDYDYEYYETVIYPEIKKNTNLFDLIAFGDRPERLKTKED